MSVIFIIISILLNIITIFAVIILYLRQDKLLKAENKQKETIREIEDLMSAYVLQMKEENDIFISKLNGKQKAQPLKSSELSHVDTTETPKDDLIESRQEKVISSAQITRKNAANAYRKPFTDEGMTSDADFLLNQQNDKVEISMSRRSAIKTVPVQEAGKKRKSATDLAVAQHPKENQDVPATEMEQMIALHEQGCSVEEIAKKLNKGRTEIELLFKFRR